MEPFVFVPCVLTLNTITVSCVASWYKEYRSLGREKRYELLNRITGVMFQLYICYSGFYLNSHIDVDIFLQTVAGYMTYELGHMILYTSSIPMYIHHGVVLFFVASRSYFTDESQMRYAIYIWMLESTAPLLSVCWYLHLFKYPDTVGHMAVKLLGFLYWSVIRVVIFPYILYTNEPLSVCLGGSTFVALNLYWFTLLSSRIWKSPLPLPSASASASVLKMKLA